LRKNYILKSDLRLLIPTYFLVGPIIYVHVVESCEWRENQGDLCEKIKLSSSINTPI